MMLADPRRFAVALLCLAFLPRLLVALHAPAEPVWDGHYYHFGAERIAAGLGYSEDVVLDGVLRWKPWCHYPVGYSAVLALLYRWFGAGRLVAPLLNAVLGAALAWLAWRLGRQGLSEPRARAAGVLVAVHPGLVAYTALVMNELLSATLVLGAGLALFLRGRLLPVLAGGGLLGVATLVRPSLLLLVPLVALLSDGGLGRRLLRTGAVGLVALAVTLPWTLRNCRVMDGCAFVSTNGGWNLAIGALTTTGRFTTLRASDGCAAVRGQVHQDRCWAEVGRRRIAADPLGWLALAPLKLAQTFNHESFPIEYLREARPGSWPEARRVAARQALSAFHQALVSLAALGMVAWPARESRGRWLQVALAVGLLGLAVAFWAADGEQPFWVLVVVTLVLGVLPLPGRPPVPAPLRYALGVLGATALTHVVFFGDDRYHVVASPALCLLAAAALRRPSAGRGRG